MSAGVGFLVSWLWILSGPWSLAFSGVAGIVAHRLGALVGRSAFVWHSTNVKANEFCLDEFMASFEVPETDPIELGTNSAPEPESAKSSREAS
jgi:hypothetical protein